VYVGEEVPFGRIVWVDDGVVRRLLPLRCEDRAVGYVWGRAGRSARDLARSILCDALNNDVLAERLCRDFTCDVVRALAWDGFQLSQRDVVAWVEAREG